MVKPSCEPTIVNIFVLFLVFALLGCGIYEIVNRKTNKRYIGSTKSFLNRFNQHRSELEIGIHHNDKLQQAARREISYLEFRIRVCLVDKSKDNLLLWETLEMIHFPRSQLYNEATPCVIQEDGEKFSVMKPSSVSSLDNIKRRIFGGPDEN